MVVSAGPLLPSFLSCPACRGPLARSAGHVSCAAGHRYPVAGETIDFLPEQHQPEDAAWRAGCHPEFDEESAGMRARLDRFIIPRMVERGLRLSGARVLDDGCGVGSAVDHLIGLGADAYGIDSGSRRERWSGSGARRRLYVANGGRLPFDDASFDLVISSGVIEHVGEPLPRCDRDRARQRYIVELIRVLRPGGWGVVAQPNGAHPFDYWHATRWGVRPHRPYEGWMPSAGDIRRWAAAAPHAVAVYFPSPEGFLAMERVRRYWYGRVLAGSMHRLFRLISACPALAVTPLNPWLVTEIARL